MPDCRGAYESTCSMFMTVAVVSFVLVAFAGSAWGQGTWSDPGTSTFQGTATATLDAENAPGCIPVFCSRACDADNPPGNCPLNGFINNAFGWSFGRWAHARCAVPTGGPCNMFGKSDAKAVVGGVGSSTAEIRWWVNAVTRRTCDCNNYLIHAEAELDTEIELVIDTVPPGQPVQVNFLWWAVVNRWTDCEAAGDDPARIENVSFEINGTPVIAMNSIDIDGSCATPNAHLFLPGNPAQSTGTIAAHGGDVITIRITGEAEAQIAPPPIVGTIHDRSWSHFHGQLLLSIDQPLAPISNPAIPGNSTNEFSVKIGSDAEMSDPGFDAANRDEVFDPGDMYPWHGAPLGACGDSGVRDDVLAFTADFWPQAPDCIADPAAGGTGAETCGVPLNNFDLAIAQNRFDLDGSDAIDTELRFLIPPNQPLDAPLAAFASSCIHGPDPFLLISYADDMPHHYAVDLCQVPSRSPSSFSGTYGTDADRDEVMMLSVVPVPSNPDKVSFSGPMPVFSESQLHPNLAPSPNPANQFDPLEQQDDNDVDALDVNVHPSVNCETWYISADKEATGTYQGLPLDPASIYEVLQLGGMTKVIDGAIHLGLPPGTDVNAFEFVWLRWCNNPNDPTDCQIVLGVVFSVDENDGVGVLDLMPGNEDGGLDPRKIYASYLTGTHFEYSPDVLDDNIDAIAASPIPFVTGPAAGPVVNDDCADAVPIFTGVTTVDTQGATTDGPPEPCGFLGDVAGNSDADIWYEFVSPCDGPVSFTFEPQYDQLVAMYHGVCPMQGGVPVACEFIPAGSLQTVTLNVVAGETYIIRIGGMPAQTGTGEVTIACACERFDAYSPLADLPSQSPWEAWANDPAAANFFVTAAQSLSPPHSVAIDDDDDAVHQYSGYTSGQWTYRAWVYVPQGANDSQAFILLNTYPATSNNHWSLQLELDANAGTVNDLNSTATLPLVTDQWVEIRVEIDLDGDGQMVFYDNQLLVSKGWTDGVAAGGALNIAAVNLYGSGSGHEFYYDDLCIEDGPAPCPGDLNGDGVVDVSDLLLLLTAWGPCAACPADFNGDGVVDVSDLLVLLAAWGPCP